MTTDTGVWLSLRYDLRAPSFAAPAAALYRAALEQCAWAEDHGFAMVTLSEHHGADDGYCPSPLVMAAAVAGRTRSLRVLIAALVLPLYDPIRLAEDLAVLDLASGGRVDLILGAGYRPEEMAMFGRRMSDRAALLEEGIAVLRSGIAPHALHETNSYGGWLAGAEALGPYASTDDADGLRASGDYLVLTPDECVAVAREHGSLMLHPLMGGLDPDLAWESLELIASKVIPHLRAPG